MLTLITLVGLVARVFVQDMLTQLVPVRTGHVADGALNLVDVLAGVLLQQIVGGEFFVTMRALEHQITGVARTTAVVDKAGKGGEEGATDWTRDELLL